MGLWIRCVISVNIFLCVDSEILWSNSTRIVQSEAGAIFG